MPAQAAVVARALALLGKRNLVLSLHDPSFPCAPGEDTGRGSPYTRGGRAFLEFAAELGFTGIQLGPQGLTSPGNPSPYDATIFARNPLSIDLFALAHEPRWAGILRPDTLDRLVAAAPSGPRVRHRHVHAAHTAALAEAAANLAAGARHPDAATRVLLADLAAFTATHHAWLERNALYSVLAAQHGEDWRHWPDPVDRHLHGPGPGEAARAAARRAELLASQRDAIAGFECQQFIAHRQHDELRVHTRRLGLDLYGDLQIGVSLADLWAHHALFLADYRMGAPPSRTNPAGQPWNYPVLDPAQYTAAGRPGPVLEFMHARVDKLLGEFDGLRIDHPHGLICPWVYRADDPDPLHAVQTGARLFASPDLPDHQGLARHAIARRDQLSPDPTTPRHADDWVRALDDAQVDAYSALLDVVLAAADGHGRPRSALLCEVLSTQPYPLRRVMQRHGLGRFRVTQKADLADPADVYRSENADPADWIMVGNHDTPTIWALVDRWRHTAVAAAQARHLAARLAPEDTDVTALARDLAADPRRLAHAKFADIFASPARNVLIFFADLLGHTDAYNVPGTVDDANWSLRIDADYARRYAAQRCDRSALDLPSILAMALRRRGPPATREHTDVLAALDALAAEP
jgi:4-alpha-glucanotransferase